MLNPIGDKPGRCALSYEDDRPDSQALNAWARGLSAPIHISVRGGMPIRADSMSMRQVKSNVISVATIGAEIAKVSPRFNARAPS